MGNLITSTKKLSITSKLFFKIFTYSYNRGDIKLDINIKNYKKIIPSLNYKDIVVNKEKQKLITSEIQKIQSFQATYMHKNFP